MLRFYKNCTIEFFASGDDENMFWACFVTFPDEESEYLGDEFISLDSAYFKAIQVIDIGLISYGSSQR